MFCKTCKDTGVVLVPVVIGPYGIVLEEMESNCDDCAELTCQLMEKEVLTDEEFKFLFPNAPLELNKKVSLVG